MPSEQRSNKNRPGELMMSGIEDAARTAINGEATLSLLPGLFVAVPIGGEGNLESRPVVLPVSSASIVWGVIKKWIFRDTHPPKDPVAVYHRGYVGVLVATAVKAGDPVYAIFTPGPTQGYATNVPGTNAVIASGARFVSTTPAMEVAIAALNMP